MTGRNEVARLRRRLDNVFARAPSSSMEIELQADFAKYLCVLVSGFLENALIALVLDMAQRRSAPEVQLFVERSLQRWTNPNAEKICQLLGGFNASWANTTREFMEQGYKETINGLVGVRHQVAHGESLGTSLAQVREYRESVYAVVAFVADLLDPPQITARAG